MGKLHALAGVIGERQRQIIDAVVDEITAPMPDQYGLTLMPVAAKPAALIMHEKISGFGGLTGERNYNEKGLAISGSSSDTFYWEPGAYQEHIRYGEKDLLMLRKYGTIGDRGITGLATGQVDELSRAGEKLKKRLMNRLNKLAWDSIFTGSWAWKGRTQSFGIPGANTIAAATDWSVAATGKPFTDLNNIIKTNPLVMKYLIKEFVINPKTEADILNTEEVRLLIRNNAQAIGDINKVAQMLYPGLPPFKVVKDSWQNESIVDGKVVLGNTTYFVPDDRVLLVPDFAGTLYGLYGEIQVVENMNAPEATAERPAVGVYTFVDELGLLERESPYVKVVAGFNGGPNLYRSNDVVVVTC